MVNSEVEICLRKYVVENPPQGNVKLFKHPIIILHQKSGLFVYTNNFYSTNFTAKYNFLR